jgi:hypothetical protein
LQQYRLGPDLLLEVLEPRPEGQHRRIEASELASGVPALKHLVSRGIHQTGATMQFGNLVVQVAPARLAFTGLESTKLT